MKSPMIGWILIALAFTALSASAIVDREWFDVGVCALGVLSAGVGLAADRQARARLAWHQRIVEAQTAQLRAMRHTRQP